MRDNVSEQYLAKIGFLRDDYVELEYIVYNIYGLSQDEINYVNSL